MGARDDEGENVWLLQKKKKQIMTLKVKNSKTVNIIYIYIYYRRNTCVRMKRCTYIVQRTIYAAYRRRNIQGDFCFAHKFFRLLNCKYLLYAYVVVCFRKTISVVKPTSIFRISQTATPFTEFEKKSILQLFFSRFCVRFGRLS